MGGFDRRSFVRGENVGEKASRNQKTDTSREIQPLSVIFDRKKLAEHNDTIIAERSLCYD